MKHVLVLAGFLGACTGEGNQIIVELDGPMAANSVELVFALPHVFIKRDQRINMAPLDPDDEPAFYVVQRRKLDLVFEGLQPVDGVELQLVGADDLLPIAIARDEQHQIVGMGVLDPPQVFRLDDDNFENFPTHLDQLADITRYPIVIEPVVNVNVVAGPGRPVSIGSGQVHQIQCTNESKLSGIVWRPEPVDTGVHHQLRIVMPLADGDDALGRVEAEGLDLDCDGHTPAIRGFIPEGDEVDCDDTSPLVNGDTERREACDQLDSDCNENTMGADVMPSQCASCFGNKVTCYEGGSVLDGAGCAPAARCHSCSPHIQSDAGTLVGCESHGTIPLPAECGDQCVIRVVSTDPRWDVKIGDVGDPKFGITENYSPPANTNTLGIAVLPTNNPPISAADPDLVIVLGYQPSPGGKVFVIEIGMAPTQATTHTIDTCAVPEIMPACGPAG